MHPAPMLAKIVVNATTTWSAKVSWSPSACAMNSTAAAW
jgi:hypothetical protein